ncbi:Hypothetical predicted protein [Mytilus galloprovincialis]|nr:Hypothetical predicted protein [Mytilus galloprovincialis]
MQANLSHAGQQCLSCSNVEIVQDCQHYVFCDNTEVCFKHKYMTESGGSMYDLGCAMPETCNHLIGSIFGKRTEGHHLTCTACCNNTRLCNQDIPCSNMKPNVTKLLRECSDIAMTNPADGVYTIYPDGKRALPVYCDMTTANFRWTVIQRRINGFVDFYRGWSAYKEGFGNVSGEYWLGNVNIHEITSHNNHEIRIELEDFEGNKRYAEYTIFSIADEESNFRLLVYNYSGNAGDSFSYHNGMMFSTFDKDNDPYSPSNCAVGYSGAWWYGECHYSNLNGKYLAGHHTSYANGIEWTYWKGSYYSMKSTKMMIRKH